MRPLLACDVPTDLSCLPYPLLSSAKLDGIRCLIKDGVAYSRTLKPIRNRYIQSTLGRPEYNGLDGELIVGDPTAKDCMRNTNSGVMSIEGEPDFKYYIFDIWDRFVPYHSIVEKIITTKLPYITPLVQQLCRNSSDIESREREALDEGYEGLILRRPDGMYKHGRSTLREGYLFKLKRYLQEEAVIVGYEPLYRNENYPELNALGYTQRSSAQNGKVEFPLLGALIVNGNFQGQAGVTFSIGTGFTLHEREFLWRNRWDLVGKTVTYKFFPTGSKDRPRHPVFKSFRDNEDI